MQVMPFIMRRPRWYGSWFLCDFNTRSLNPSDSESIQKEVSFKSMKRLKHSSDFLCIPLSLSSQDFYLLRPVGSRRCPSGSTTGSSSRSRSSRPTPRPGPRRRGGGRWPVADPQSRGRPGVFSQSNGLNNVFDSITTPSVSFSSFVKSRSLLFSEPHGFQLAPFPYPQPRPTV